MREAELREVAARPVDGHEDVVRWFVFGVKEAFETESAEIRTDGMDHVDDLFVGDLFAHLQGQVLEVLGPSDGIDGVGTDQSAAFELEAFQVGAEFDEGLYGLIIKCCVEPLQLQRLQLLAASDEEVNPLVVGNQVGSSKEDMLQLRTLLSHIVHIRIFELARVAKHNLLDVG